MIRESLLNWKVVTDSLIQCLEKDITHERESSIQQINELLDIRESYKKDIFPPFNDDEKDFGKTLIKLESILAEKLEILAKNISVDIELNQKKKTSLQAYLNPYNKVFRDGTFYDTKK